MSVKPGAAVFQATQPRRALCRGKGVREWAAHDLLRRPSSDCPGSVCSGHAVDARSVDRRTRERTATPGGLMMPNWSRPFQMAPKNEDALFDRTTRHHSALCARCPSSCRVRWRRRAVVCGHYTARPPVSPRLNIYGGFILLCPSDSPSLSFSAVLKVRGVAPTHPEEWCGWKFSCRKR